GQVYSTIPVGYRGEPIEGQFTKRKKPRCNLAIDEAAAEYVRRIFTWFVEQMLTIEEIVRRLNDDPAAPEPPKSLEGDWTRKSVIGVLSNKRYRAEWPCSATETKWLSKADYARQFPRAEPLGVFVHEHLRIVSDEIWFRAQVRLTKTAKRSGRKPGNSKRKPRSKLLNGILVCPEHERQLYVGGPRGRSFYCKDCRETVIDKRPLFTLLPQGLAVRLTLTAIKDLVAADEGLVASIVMACQTAANGMQQPDSSRENELRARDRKLKAAIEFALRNPGQTPAEEEETRQLVGQFRRERADVQAELGLIEAARNRPVRVPTREEVKSDLQQLDAILLAAQSGSIEEQSLARGIVELVTGGQIELTQMGERVRGRGWLQGTFQCDIVGLLASRLAGQVIRTGDPAPTVVIDFREPSTLDEQANSAKELYDQGILNVEIGHEMGCSKSRVTQLLRHWFESRGQSMPDGRSRRSQLKRKHREPPPYQEIADGVMELVRENWLLQDIATKLNVDRDMVTAAIRYWHESRGLAVPDGRSRRKHLPRRGNSRRRRIDPE
ncbi:MAG: recombinase family protein, partial [Phycisphaerales bacterium]|nr:recombinase family protein [Phycisphaerales bacterium]